MISLLTEPLPDCIEADGRRLPIVTDFRDWLKFILLLGDKNLTDHMKAVMLPEWLITPQPLTRGIVEGLRYFCEAMPLEPDPPEGADGEADGTAKPPVWDWAFDAKYVLGDFRRYYGLDLLRTEYLHWWEFKALFLSLPTESRSMERIGIRGTDLSKIKDRNRQKAVAQMQRRIALPFRVDEDSIADVFASMM